VRADRQLTNGGFIISDISSPSARRRLNAGSAAIAHGDRPDQLYSAVGCGAHELTLELRSRRYPAPTSPQSGIAPGGASNVHLRFKFLAPLPKFNWTEWGIDLLRGWGPIFILGLLWLWFRRGALERSGGPLLARPWRTLGIGLIVLVVSLNLFVVALLAVAVVFGIGLGLNALGLWPITIASWVVAYSALAAAVTFLALFIAYGSKILVFYHLISWLFGRTSWPRTAWMAALALFTGTLIYALCGRHRSWVGVAVKVAGNGFRLAGKAQPRGGAWRRSPRSRGAPLRPWTRKSAGRPRPSRPWHNRDCMPRRKC
jgi:hypothetical protein